MNILQFSLIFIHMCIVTSCANIKNKPELLLSFEGPVEGILASLKYNGTMINIGDTQEKVIHVLGTKYSKYSYVYEKGMPVPRPCVREKDKFVSFVYDYLLEDFAIYFHFVDKKTYNSIIKKDKKEKEGLYLIGMELEPLGIYKKEIPNENIMTSE